MLQLLGVVGFLIAVTAVALGTVYGLNWVDLNRVWRKEQGLVMKPLIIGISEALFIFCATRFVSDILEETPPIGWQALVFCVAGGWWFLAEVKKLAEAAVREKQAAPNEKARDMMPEEQDAFGRIAELKRMASGRRDPP